MDHLGAGVRLLGVVGHGHGVEFADAAIAFEDATRVLPGDGGSGLDLRPADLGAGLTDAALGHEVEDAAFAFRVAGIPVLDGAVLDFCVVLGDELDARGVQLVLVALGGGAPFEVADVAAFFRHHEGPLELPGARFIDAEVGGQFHRTLHALGDVAEGAVGEDGRVEGAEEVVLDRDDRAEVLADQLGVLLDGLAHRAENDAELGQLVLEGGGHGHAVHDEVHRHSGQALLLLHGDAELVHGGPEFGIDLIKGAERGLGLGRAVIADGLVVRLFVFDMGPLRLLHLLPDAEGLQTPFEHPIGFVLLGADEADDVLVQPRRRFVGLDVRGESEFVLLPGEFVQQGILFCGAHRAVFRWRNSPRSHRFGWRWDCGTRSPCR